MNTILVGGLEHVLFFHILGIIIPNDEHIFQRGRYTTNQCIYIYIVRYLYHHNQLRAQVKYEVPLQITRDLASKVFGASADDLMESEWSFHEDRMGSYVT